MSEDSPLVSIVVLTYNRRNELRETLSELKKQTYPHCEVIVVDNGCIDGTWEMVSQEFPIVRLIRLPRNVAIEGFNHGFVNARGKYIIALDDDAQPENERVVERIVEEFERDERLGIVGAKVLNFYTRQPSFGRQWIDLIEQQGEIEFFAFDGCGAGIRKEVLDRVGFYPAEYYIYINELHLSFRAIQVGYKIKVFNDIIFLHKQSPGGSKPLRAFLATRNMIWLIRAYFSFPANLNLILGLILFRYLRDAWRQRKILAYLRGIVCGLLSFPGKRISRFSRSEMNRIPYFFQVYALTKNIEQGLAQSYSLLKGLVY